MKTMQWTNPFGTRTPMATATATCRFLSCPAWPPIDHVSNSDDCDDCDNAQYPGADEYCNTEDDDCDGNIDEAGAVDALPFYPDNDGDGYGLDFVATYACSAQPGTVADNTDCDDTTAQVRPGAASSATTGTTIATGTSMRMRPMRRFSTSTTMAMAEAPPVRRCSAVRT